MGINEEEPAWIDAKRFVSKIWRHPRTQSILFIAACTSVLTAAALHTGTYYTPAPDVLVYCLIYSLWLTVCLPWLVKNLDRKTLFMVAGVLLRLFAAEAGVLAWGLLRGHGHFLQRALRMRPLLEPSLSWLADAGYNLRYGVIVSSAVAAVLATLADIAQKIAKRNSRDQLSTSHSFSSGRLKGTRAPSVGEGQASTVTNLPALRFLPGRLDKSGVTSNTGNGSAGPSLDTRPPPAASVATCRNETGSKVDRRATSPSSEYSDSPVSHSGQDSGGSGCWCPCCNVTAGRARGDGRRSSRSTSPETQRRGGQCLTQPFVSTSPAESVGANGKDGKNIVREERGRWKGGDGERGRSAEGERRSLYGRHLANGDTAQAGMAVHSMAAAGFPKFGKALRRRKKCSDSTESIAGSSGDVSPFRFAASCLNPVKKHSPKRPLQIQNQDRNLSRTKQTSDELGKQTCANTNRHGDEGDDIYQVDTLEAEKMLQDKISGYSGVDIIPSVKTAKVNARPSSSYASSGVTDVGRYTKDQTAPHVFSCPSRYKPKDWPEFARVRDRVSNKRQALCSNNRWSPSRQYCKHYAQNGSNSEGASGSPHRLQDN